MQYKSRIVKAIDILILWLFLLLSNNRPLKIKKESLGSAYGGYWLCSSVLQPGSTVYSFGIGEDISFDLAVIQQFQAQVFAFDPTPRALKHVESQQVPESFRFMQLAISTFDGEASFNPPPDPEHVSYTLLERPERALNAITVQTRKLATLMEMLKHQHIDVLKIDIEGSEYPVLQNVVDEEITPGQILVEFHHHMRGISVFQTIGIIRLLARAGYRLYGIQDRYVFSFINDKALEKA